MRPKAAISRPSPSSSSLNLPARATAFWNTLVLAPVGALLCLLVAYPVAYYLALRANPRYRLVLVSLVVVPFWTSLLVRTYAWMYILGSRGIPNLLDMIGCRTSVCSIRRARCSSASSMAICR